MNTEHAIADLQRKITKLVSEIAEIRKENGDLRMKVNHLLEESKTGVILLDGIKPGGIWVPKEKNTWISHLEIVKIGPKAKVTVKRFQKTNEIPTTLRWAVNYLKKHYLPQEGER